MIEQTNGQTNKRTTYQTNKQTNKQGYEGMNIKVGTYIRMNKQKWGRYQHTNESIMEKLRYFYGQNNRQNY